MIQSQGFAAILTSLFLVALVTTLVLPNRPTPKIITAFFDSLSAATQAVINK